MKSTFNKLLACTGLMLSFVAKQACADNLMPVLSPAHIAMTHELASNNHYSRLPLVAIAALDDDQAGSTEAETMLA